MVVVDWAKARVGVLLSPMVPGKKLGMVVGRVLGVVALVGAAIGLEACADRGVVSEVSTSQASSSPATVNDGAAGAATGRNAVVSFLTDIEAGNADPALVQSDQLALLVGLEEPTGELMVSLLDDGVPAGVADNFWESLADSFQPFSGAGLEGWAAGDDRAVIVDGVTFVFVEIEHETGSSELVARDTGSGWVVDLVASFGHAFAPVVNFWIDNEPAGAGVWAPAMVDQELSVQMAIERTDGDSIYQEDLSGWLSRIRRLS